jgi:hypothetical protein
MEPKRVFERAPFALMAPLIHVLYFASILVLLLLWPFVLTYGFAILCPFLWIVWGRSGTDVLLVVSNTPDGRDWTAQI